MPKIKSVKEEILTEVIIKNKKEIFNISAQKIWGPTHKCWANIANELNNKVSPKYIYTVVLQNRYNIYDLLNFKRSSQEFVSKNDISFSSSSDDDSESHTLIFNITLSFEEWSSIYDSEKRIYKRSDRNTDDTRNYDVLIPYQWTNIIHEHFFEQTRKSCAISYKHAKVCQMGNTFLKIIGHCPSCNSVFKGIVQDPPETDSRVIIECSYIGSFNNCSSGLKRRIY